MEDYKCDLAVYAYFSSWKARDMKSFMYLVSMMSQTLFRINS
jgi:hypothetical protein